MAHTFTSKQMTPQQQTDRFWDEASQKLIDKRERAMLSRTNRTIVTRIKAAVKSGTPVLVDGWIVRDARIWEGELEVEWYAEIPNPSVRWTAIQPNFMAMEDGNLIIKTD